MAPFYEHPTTGTGTSAGLMFFVNLVYLATALRGVAIRRDRHAFCILGFAAANAVFVVRPTRRSFRVARLRTVCSLLAWMSHTLETAYFLPAVVRLTHWVVWMVLLGCTALYYYPFARDGILLYVLRGTTWESVLLLTNRVARGIGYPLLLWFILGVLGSMQAFLCLAAIMLLVIAPFALYHPLCVLQDRLSDWRVRRARGPNGNAWNPAACMPPEVQLLVFHLLRTRGRFGSREHLARDTDFGCDVRLVPFSGARDLAAASRVCLAWRAAATDALYRDAVLLTAWRTCAFSKSLGARPALAHLVRRIVLPEWEVYSPEGEGRMHGATWSQFSAAIEHIVSHCVHATDIRLFRDQTPLLDHIPGLRAATGRVSHLAIQSGIPCRYGGLTEAHEPEEIDLTLLLGWLPALTSLTLTGQMVTFDVSALRHSQRRALGGISALCLGACTLEILDLVLLLRQLPRLRITELHSPEFSGSYGTIEIAELFATQRDTLVELRLLVKRNLPAEQRRIEFSALGAFSALSTLAINTYMLPALVALPPNLGELVVSFAPRSCDYRFRVTGGWKKHLFDAVAVVSSLAPTVPTLRSVQLWDVVLLKQLAHWSVAAFILRGMLSRAGVALDVNLFIEMFNNFRVKCDLTERKKMRRFFWKGVL